MMMRYVCALLLCPCTSAACMHHARCGTIQPSIVAQYAVTHSPIYDVVAVDKVTP